MRHTPLLRLLTATAGAALAIAGAEALVRATVGMPRTPAPLDADLPALHEPDPELGWRNKAGAVEWPGRGADEGRPIALTFWPGGLRATSALPGDGRPEVAVIGCSYTQGWAVTDAETYAWRLQERFPSLGFRNLGTAAYGTFQSLLALERFLPARPAAVALVLYGFIEHHEVRNVAPAGWLRELRTTLSASVPLGIPFATLDTAGRIERHRPQATPRWPLGDRLASVGFLESRLADAQSAARMADRRSVTEALLGELRDASAAHGAQLLVVILEAGHETRRHYRSWLPRHGIRVADCSNPHRFDRAFKVQGYGHPSREVHTRWAACIAPRVEALLKDPPRLESAAAPAAH